VAEVYDTEDERVRDFHPEGAGAAAGRRERSGIAVYESGAGELRTRSHLRHSGERPMAAASLWVGADGKVRREFTSLTDQELRCVREGETVWAPRSGIVTKKPIPEAPKPASTSAARLAQMRRLADRFSADFDTWPAKGWENLRLLPQPLYRYTSADHGVVDGAIFALAQSNDPEVLLVLELARPSPDAMPAWSYAFARMSSKRMRARLDDQEVWSVEGYYSKPRTPEDPYQEAEDGKYP
jgi:hypothetical protein